MISSMTGYAEKRTDHKNFSVRVVIKTLNHRFFDWNYHGDRIGDIEERFRKICKDQIYRGRVDVFLDIRFSDDSSFDLYLNRALLKKIYSSLQEVEKEFQKKINIHLENLFDVPHLIELSSREFSRDEIGFLEDTFRTTLNQLLNERKKEGKRLLKGIKKHLNNINNAVVQIGEMAKDQPAVIRKKFMDRMKRLSHDAEISEERIAEETALYAQKYDINEEIERLKSHLHFCEGLLSDKGKKPVGKKIDFTSQEILRETNTINSKTQEIKIINKCLSVKSELESIRQQVRNLE